MNREEKLYLMRQASRVNEIGEISDGFHTFNSLYSQRLYLWAALVKAYKDKAWKSKKHNDGKPCFGGGWFLVGISTPAGDYTYHYKLEHWGLFNCKVLDKAPEFDGHTDKDITRVLTLQPCYASQWIPVEKELPPKRKDPIVISEKVFIHTTGGHYLSAVYDYQDKEWIDEYNIETLESNEVTHWMPIVPPRKEK